MPSRGSGFAVAVARTTLSPRRTTTAPWACLANLPVSNDIVFPPASVTVTVLGSGFIECPSECNQQEVLSERNERKDGCPISGRLHRRWDFLLPTSSSVICLPIATLER